MSSFSSSNFVRPMDRKAKVVMRGDWVTEAEAKLIDAGKMPWPKPVPYGGESKVEKSVKRSRKQVVS